MPSFRETIDIAAEPAATWAVLGDLASMAHWVPGVADVKIDGMTRVCTFADGRVQHEQIEDYSAATRSFRYAIEGGLPVRDNRGGFVVEGLPVGSRVVWDSSFEAIDPADEAQITEMWSAALPVVLGNLKQLVETSPSG